MNKAILIIVLSCFLTTEMAAQEVGSTKEVEAVNVDIEANWRPAYIDPNQAVEYEKRFVQRTFDYTPPEGWVITSYRLAHEYSRGGNLKVLFEEDGDIQLSEDELSNVYLNLINYAEQAGDEDLKSQIKTDYNDHKELRQKLKTNYNRMIVFAEVESHGETPRTRTMALRNKGVMQANVKVLLVYLGTADGLLNKMVQKYDLEAVAKL